MNGNVKSAILIQLENAPSAIVNTELGTETDSRFSQFWNAYAPIDVTPSGITIACKPVQSMNIMSPRPLFRKITDVKNRHPSNTFVPIFSDTTLAGIIMLVRWLYANE